MAEPSDNAPQNGDLDTFFASARASGPPDLPDALYSRIMADAAAAQPVPRTPRPAGIGGWRALLDGLGGWPSLAGLTTAALAGVWIGVLQPDTVLILDGGLGFVTVPSGSAATYALEDLMPGVDTLSEEQ